VNDAAFAATSHPFLFLLETSRHDDIGVLRGFRQEEIDHPEVFELIESFAREIRVRKRDHRLKQVHSRALISPS